MVPETRIRGLHNTAHGILVDVECWCGTRVAIRTGRRRAGVRRLDARASGRSGHEQTNLVVRGS